MNDLSTHGVVVLIKDTKGRYLMLKDSRKNTKDWWAPPHGRCKSSDKSEINAVIREVYEETGLKVTNTKKLHTQKADTKVKTVSFWSAETLDTKIKLNSESSDYGWYTSEEALKLQLYPGTMEFFQKLTAK